MLMALLVTSLIATALAGLMIHNSRINKAQQLFAAAQLNARGSMELIVTKLRSAGWDPINAGIDNVETDPIPGDAVSQIEIFADLDEDGVTTSDGEQLLIRHVDDRIELRRTGDPSAPFSIVAVDISNDADDDGVIEPLFRPDDPIDPEVVTVQVTARSTAPDPRTGKFIRYTLRSDVALRKN
jgi:hypothetical protein